MSATDTITKAVIYTRVSGAKQVREGDGLASQENRCREYCTYKDYDVVETFADDMSGKFERRPAMDRMLAFLRLHPKGSVAVIIDDISRFARGLEAHIALRQTLADAGGVLESPSIEFGEDSDSRLVENMLASVAQHQREKNAEQTSNRMKGRLMNGYAVFTAPLGYAYKKTGSHGKLLTRVEPLASVIKDGLEAYASGRITTQAELKRHFEAQPEFPKCLPNGQIRQQRISDLLSRVIYAGYVEHEPWGVSRRLGHHEPIISLETFERIQQRRNARAVAPKRKDISEDFPLRGAVCCATCDTPMTSCWSRSGTGKRYPYYFCHNRDCADYRTNIRAEKIDTAFEAILRTLTPSAQLLSIAVEMLKDAVKQRGAQDAHRKTALKRKLVDLNKQQDKLIERLVEATNEKVAAALEAKIAKLESEKLLTSDQLAQAPQKRELTPELFELLRRYLSSPWKLYESGNLKVKKSILNMAFAAPLAYHPKGGFRTPQTSVIFTFLEKCALECEMVHP